MNLRLNPAQFNKEVNPISNFIGYPTRRRVNIRLQFFEGDVNRVYTVVYYDSLLSPPDTISRMIFYSIFYKY